MYMSHYVYLVNYLHYSKRFVICKNYFAFFDFYFDIFSSFFACDNQPFRKAHETPRKAAIKAQIKPFTARKRLTPLWFNDIILQ